MYQSLRRFYERRVLKRALAAWRSHAAFMTQLAAAAEDDWRETLMRRVLRLWHARVQRAVAEWHRYRAACLPTLQVRCSPRKLRCF